MAITGERDGAHPVPVRFVDDRLVHQSDHFVESAEGVTVHRLGGGRFSVLRPSVVASVAPKFAVVAGAAGIMPTDEQAVAKHVADEKSIDYRSVALEVLYGTVESNVENHPDLQLSRYDCDCFEGFHECRRVADTGHRAIENVTVDKIGKRNDGALLEFRYAIGFKERVEVRIDLGNAGNMAVEDVSVGCVQGQRNDEYPTVRACHGTGIGRLQNRSVPFFPDDRRTAGG